MTAGKFQRIVKDYMAEENRFIEERHQQILELLREYGRITVKDLCNQFRVSNVTIRNDLNDLEKQDLLIRTHGGAMARENNSSELPFSVRMQKHSDEKHRMARAASQLIENGEAVFIDGGTTASVIRHYLTGKKDLTIITPSIEVTSHLAMHESIRIFVMGGFFKRESLSTIGASSANVIDNWNIAKAFHGAYGFTPEHGLTDIDPGFIEQKRYIAGKAQVNIGMIDSSKWGKMSLDTFLETKNIDVLITDKNASPEMEEAASQYNIEFIIV